MQPNLALAYDSGAGNGIVGVGWKLAGLSSISRVNYGNGVNYDGLDTYWHSSLGVLVLQPDGSYRSKKESFTRFFKYGTCGDGPCSWIAQYRTGSLSWYGTSVDSRLLKQSTPSVRLWGLSHVGDQFPNSYRVTYANDAANGTLYPANITYTYGPGLSTYRTVEFQYQPRTDVEQNYALSAFEQTTQRLQWIVVKSNGTLIRQYRLDYECGTSNTPDCPTGTETGRSRLKAVTEFGSDGVSMLPVQTFGYQVGGAGFTYSGSLNPPADFTSRDANTPTGWDNGVRIADLNGDGKPDLIQGWYSYGTENRNAWINTGTSWVQSVAFAPPADFAGRDGGALKGWDAGLRLVDLNGDGYPDLIQGWYNYGTFYLNAWLNNGGNCSTPGCAWTPVTVYAPPTVFTGRDATAPTGWDQGLRVADLNGDGKPDLMYGFQNQAANGTYSTATSAWLNTGNGWAPAPALAPPVGFAGRDKGTPAGWDQGLRLADLNGDGKPDLIYGWYSYGATYNGAWINTANGWATNGAYVPPSSSYFAGRDSSASQGWDGGLRVVDLNGDGKSDLIYGSYNYGTTYNGAWINTGSGWTANSAYSPPVAFSGRDGVAPRGWDQGLRLIDLNGDGKADLVYSWWDYGTTRKGAWVNSGTGWTANNSYAPPAAYGARFAMRDASAPTGWDNGVRLADLNGDGRPDVVMGSSGARWAWTLPNQFPDLMTSVSNGFGGTVTVTYTPAPQVPGAVGVFGGFGIPNRTPRHLVTQVTARDGRGATYSAFYVYADARLWPGTIPNQRNLGFGSVTVTDGQTGQYVRTSYNQNPGFEGHVSEVDAYTSTNQLASKTTYAYDLVNPSSGTEMVRETQNVVYAYEPLPTAKYAYSQTATTVYDGYGNATVKTQSADDLPSVTVTTTYANDTENWILGRVTDVKTTSGSTTLAETTNTWTNNTVTARSSWLDTSNTLVTTAMTYDANGNLLTVTEPLAGDGLTRTTRLAYDATFNAYPIRIANALGQSAQLTYDPAGLVTSVTDANGAVTRVTYDVLGRKQRETRPDQSTTDYSYINYGFPLGESGGPYAWAQHNLTVTKMDGTRTVFRAEYFDGMGFVYQVVGTGDPVLRGGSLVFQNVYVDRAKDAAGREYRVSMPHSCGAASSAWTTSAYDIAGRVSTITAPDEKVTTNVYGATSTAVIDPNGAVTLKHIDARKRLKSVIDNANQKLSYGYDALGRLISTTLPNGALTTITYDSLGRKTSITDPQLGTTTNSYDAIGNLLSVAAGGKTVTFTYDALNRVKQKQPSGEATVTYTYDDPTVSYGIGRLTSVVDSGGTTQFAYTPLGQLSNYVKAIDGSRFSQSLTYDFLGHLKHLTYPDGSYADYAYTDGANLGTVSLNGSALATWSNYNASGMAASVSYGNGVGTAYGYDVVNHLTSLSTASGTANLQNLTYDWYSSPNAGGLNVGSITDNRAPAAKIAADGSNTDETQTYAYDGIYRLTQAVGAWGTKKYAYDSVGNPTTFGGLTARTQTFNGQQLVSGTGLTAVTYDPNGYMLHQVLDGTTWDYTWTAEGQLAGVSKNGFPTAQMTYDGDGGRVKKVYMPSTGPAVTTTYVGRMYEKRTYSDGTPERHTVYVYGSGQLVASVTRSGSIATAFNHANRWRTELAAASMYDGRNVRGAAMKAFKLLSAAASHPKLTRWIVLGSFALFATAVLAAFASALTTRVRRSSRRPALRFASVGTVLVFGFAACSGGPGGNQLGQEAGYLISGDTTSGPPVGTYYHHGNHLNSSSVITNSIGSEVTRISYLPFGEFSQQNSSGTDTVTLKFTGQEYDEETGLAYYRSRYYDPRTGRFLTPDSMVPRPTNLQSFNRYSYVLNNPIRYMDPSGHEMYVYPWDEGGGGEGGEPPYVGGICIGCDPGAPSEEPQGLPLPGGGPLEDPVPVADPPSVPREAPSPPVPGPVPPAVPGPTTGGSGGGGGGYVPPSTPAGPQPTPSGPVGGPVAPSGPGYDLPSSTPGYGWLPGTQTTSPSPNVSDSPLSTVAPSSLPSVMGIAAVLALSPVIRVDQFSTAAFKAAGSLMANSQQSPITVANKVSWGVVAVVGAAQVLGVLGLGLGPLGGALGGALAGIVTQMALNFATTGQVSFSSATLVAGVAGAATGALGGLLTTYAATVASGQLLATRVLLGAETGLATGALGASLPKEWYEPW